jgi:xanthine dehydrogenase YagS FAD-binding subunit
VLPFRYTRARSLSEAVAAAAAGATPLAGGTTLVDLLRAEIARPAHVVDLRRVGELRVRDTAGEPARIGALTSMAELAADPTMAARSPAVVESLRLAASGQLRTMATIGGNLRQASRCPGFRDGRSPCNRRAPGSGCAARTGPAHDQAVLGTSTACVAPYPGDLAVALIAADAEIETRSPAGARRIPVAALYRTPGATPEREHALGPGELITAVLVPRSPTARAAAFVKVRDRVSFAFALGSAAVGLDVSAGRVTAARVVLGGVATVPWRSREAESVLLGEPVTAQIAGAAAEAALGGARGPRAAAARGAMAKAYLVAASRAGTP